LNGVIKMTPEQAKQLCIQAHEGQHRRPTTLDYDTGEELYQQHGKILPCGSKITYIDTLDEWAKKLPYSSHPIAVAEMMSTDTEKVLAYLHDVVEDTEATLHVTSGGYCSIQYKDKTYEIGHYYFCQLKALTKIKGQSYIEYLIGICGSAIATKKVKIADMFHNISCNPTDKSKAKYLQGIKILLNSI